MRDRPTITAAEVGQSPDRPTGRQAVVLIHGIGDQQPMTTLRDFIGGIFPGAGGGDARVFSKPDRVSQVLETRRMSADATVAGSPTDFYELYWAHLLQGTTLGHVRDWFAVLLVRRPAEVPRRLRLVWAAGWSLVLLALAVLLSLSSSDSKALLGGLGVAGVLVLVLRDVAARVALSHVGDAARYLRPAPENIEVRRAIRTAGLEVIRRLHDEPMQRYDRIVIVGHSLGSVIAYDVLTHLWQEMHWRHTKPSAPRQPAYGAMKERLVGGQGGAGDLASFQQMQSALLREERALGMPWKVTDLVTVGSPLTYAGYLMADRRYPLEARTRSRELPTCPPQLEDARDVGYLSPSYTHGGGTTSQKKLLHHAALFACTRWTNLYFEHDIIGGPLRHLFGDGVEDVPLVGTTRRARSLLSHVLYWHPSEGAACQGLKRAMRLGEPGPEC
jgi:hypothetical protein